MKKIQLFLLSCVLSSKTYAKLNIQVVENYKDQNVLRKLQPHDMGTLHNTIMTRVHDRILIDMPESQDVYSAIMMDEVSYLCATDDTECKASTHEVTIQSKKDVEELFASGKSFDVHSIIPDGFDKDLANNFESIYNSMLTLESDGLEAYHDELDEISDIVEDSDLPETKKQLLHEVVSIAKGSGEFWTEFINNSDSILHSNHKRRHLQQTVTITINIFDVTSADVVGALRAAIRAFLENPLLLLNPASWTTELGPDVLRGAIAASLTAMGIIIKIPTSAEIISCAAATALEEQNIDLEENILVGDLVGDIFVPCNSTTLFGPFLGPIAANLLPQLFDILDDPETESNSGN